MFQSKGGGGCRGVSEHPDTLRSLDEVETA